MPLGCGRAILLIHYSAGHITALPISPPLLCSAAPQIVLPVVVTPFSQCRSSPVHQARLSRHCPADVHAEHSSPVAWDPVCAHIYISTRNALLALIPDTSLDLPTSTHAT